MSIHLVNNRSKLVYHLKKVSMSHKKFILPVDMIILPVGKESGTGL